MVKDDEDADGGKPTLRDAFGRTAELEAAAGHLERDGLPGAEELRRIAADIWARAGKSLADRCDARPIYFRHPSEPARVCRFDPKYKRAGTFTVIVPEDAGDIPI